MIIFKILLIILVALPVLVLTYIWFRDISEYVSHMNARDRKRSSGNRPAGADNDFSADGTGGDS